MFMVHTLNMSFISTSGYLVGTQVETNLIIFIE